MAGGTLNGMPVELGGAREAKDFMAGGLRFAQISDSHMGFDRPANIDVTETLRLAGAKIKAAPELPGFIRDTGDLTHLSKATEFDTLQQVMSDLALPVFYVPGEHDVLAGRATCSASARTRMGRAGTASTCRGFTSSGS